MAFKLDKSVLLNMAAPAACVLVVALIICNVNSCSTKKEFEKTNSRLEKVDSLLKINAERISIMDRNMDSLRSDNKIKSDSIVCLKDSIGVLNDSLVAVNGRLIKCKKSKGNGRPVKPATPAKPKPAVPATPKPVTPVAPKPVVPATPKPVTPVVPRPAESVPVVVNVNDGANNTTVNINNGTINNYHLSDSLTAANAQLVVIRRSVKTHTQRQVTYSR